MNGMPEPSTKVETIAVTSLDGFVKLLTGWHGKKVALLRHMQDLPDGSEMVVDSGLATEATVLMTGERLAGFKEGIDLALMELGTLPFLAEVEDAEPAVAG